MWSQIVFLATLGTIVISDTLPPGFERPTTEGATSLGYKLVYGDTDIEKINEVVSDIEKKELLKSKVNLNEAVPPLSSEDVKCLMSVNSHCSTKMSEMKSVLIQALVEDCKACTDEQKTKAGKIVVSMMTHDPVAWKMFLTRSALQITPPIKLEQKQLRYKALNDRVETLPARYLEDGLVRVKRYVVKVIP